MFAQLGDIKFETVKGFTTFNRRRAVMFSEHPRIGTKPRLQKTGVEPIQLSVTIYLHAKFCKPQDEIDALALACENGEVLPLVMGDGKVIGDFLITEVAENITQTNGTGSTIEATVDLTIRESFDPDKVIAEQAQALQDGFAIDANSPATVVPIQIVQTDAMVIGDQAMETTIKASSVNADLAAAQQNESAAPGLLEKVTDTLGDMEAGINEMQQNIDAATALAGILTGLNGSLPGVLSAIGVLSVYTEAGDLEGAAAANTALQAAVSTMWEGTALLNQNLALRR